MASHISYPEGPLVGLESARRVGWAKYFEELHHAEQLQCLNASLRARLDDLIPEFLDLVDAVLRAKNIAAFRLAYRLKQTLDDFEQGRPDRREVG